MKKNIRRAGVGVNPPVNAIRVQIMEPKILMGQGPSLSGQLRSVIQTHHLFVWFFFLILTEFCGIGFASLRPTVTCKSFNE